VASWTVSYDFPFPPESTFGKLGMLANGTVLANAQNKHSAPGLCTHSGLSLLRLFRHTGDTSDTWIMDLMRDIAHALPQYMSRADRPIPWTMPYNQPEDPSEKNAAPGLDVRTLEPHLLGRPRTSRRGVLLFLLERGLAAVDDRRTARH
jgi:hypothetical protein